MADRYTISLVMNEELLSCYYYRNDAEWSLFMDAAKMARECRGLQDPLAVKEEMEIRAFPTPEDLERVSEWPVFVDLTNKVVYHADRVLTAEEIEEMPVVDLVQIIREKNRTLTHNESFLGKGVIPFEMAGIYEYVVSHDEAQVRTLLNEIKADAFVELYENSVFGASEEEKKTIDAEIAKAIDTCCNEGVEGALRLKADLCLGSELCFSWTYPELESCLRKLIGTDTLADHETKILDFFRKKDLEIVRPYLHFGNHSEAGCFALLARDMGDSLGESREAYQYYLQSRFTGERYFFQNSIKECFLSGIRERIEKLGSVLGYPDCSDEAAIDDTRRLEELIRRATNLCPTAIFIDAAPGNKCRIRMTKSGRSGRAMQIITVPESSYCSVDAGLTLYAEKVKYVAIQKKFDRWIFDSFHATNYLDQDQNPRMKLTFYLLGEAMIQIDAARPVYLRTNCEGYQLKDEAADAAVLWMPIELSEAYSFDRRRLERTWAWAQEEIERKELTISDTEVGIQELSLFTCTEYDKRHYALFCDPLKRKALIREAEETGETKTVRYYNVANIYTCETCVRLPLIVLLNNAADLCEASGRQSVIGPALNRREKFMLKPIEELELSVRTYNCLHRQGIRTIGELCGLTMDELRGIRNLGAKSIAELTRKMKELDLQAAFLDPAGDDPG